MKNITKGIKLLSILFLALAYLGCDEDDVVLPQINAEFTQTINQDTGVVSFINTSTNANTYSWDFGDGTTSTEVNPIKVYTSGTYTVVLEAKNVAGASDTFEDTIVISIPEEIAFPITFDNPLVNYEPSVFGGASFAIVENPDASGANPTVSNVGAITNSGATFEGVLFDLGEPLNLTEDKTVKVLFWATSAVDILLKLEDGTAGDIEVTASHGGSGWEELYFTFDSAASYNGVTFFVDGPGVTSGTFYLDDITQINTNDIPCEDTDLALPIDFDCETIDYATKIVGNVSFTVVDNPELSGINATASKVGQITNVGDNFENAFFNLDVPIDFSTENSVRLKLFSNQALPILLKFEDGTEGDVENLQNHTGSGWEELTFTLGSTGSYNDMVLFVAFNQTDAGTFYIDDIEQVAGDTGGPCTPETTESIAAADLNITFQTNTPPVIEDNVAFSWIDNPDAAGPINTSCKVGQVTRFNNSPFDNLQIDLADKLDFNTSEGIKMKVWSPVANTPVLLKLEEIGNPSNFVEILQTTGAANTWTELTYDFAATATPQFNKLVIFFNFNVGDASTYYFDDLMVYGSGGGGGTCVPETSESIAAADLNITFQTNTPAIIEDNTGFSWIDNPDFAGPVNTSCKVGQAVRFNNSPFDNLQIDLAEKLDFNASEGIKMKVWSPIANTPVLLKLEEIGNAGNFVEILQTTGAANTWTELTYDFAPTATPQFNKLVIFFNFNVADGSTYYFDDIMVYGSPGGGGGPTGGNCTTGEVAASSLPLDFEGCETFPQSLNFGAGLTSGLDDNPNPSGINTSSAVLMVDKPAGSEFFAGVQNNFGSNFDLSNPSHEFRMKIYSTKPNTVFRFEVAQDEPTVGNPPPAFVTVTDANVWTEVSFTFTAMPAPTSYFRLVIKPDNDQTDSPITTGGTYYFDDIVLIE
ncbi:PKD domain-containing protein [Winogradskyella wandonensis]|uniref:PKD domain-containing protein n=1 Tax=Winogradskyella wandonensis TaxID=1442586 RepID=A0A4R1KTF0_9FLAO|nr:PKD domain-containing protein [Winogradskyella wandonensis]TCK67509.1 PKD domain-containing protein [Winogradskyella wandonensis]